MISKEKLARAKAQFLEAKVDDREPLYIYENGQHYRLLNGKLEFWDPETQQVVPDR